MKIGVYKATKGDSTIEGTAEEIAKKINCTAKVIVNAYSRKGKTNGYKIEKVGSLYEKYYLYKDNKLIDCNTLQNLAKAHFFSINTMYNSLKYKNGEIYKLYKLEPTGQFRLVEKER